MPEFEPITGRYLRVEVGGEPLRVYVGEAGGGGASVLRRAARHGGELGGIIGLESAAYAPGRANQFLHHPAVHGGEMAATYSFGLTAPGSPEECRRENWGDYSQSGPGGARGPPPAARAGGGPPVPEPLHLLEDPPLPTRPVEDEVADASGLEFR